MDLIYYPVGGLSGTISKTELQRLEQMLGKSSDIGCAHVWWYGNGSPLQLMDRIFREQHMVEFERLPLFMHPSFSQNKSARIVKNYR